MTIEVTRYYPNTPAKVERWSIDGILSASDLKELGRVLDQMLIARLTFRIIDDEVGP